MATTDKVLKARVERGAALLDAEQPGWCERIDLDVLNMTSVGDCVLGQLYLETDNDSSYSLGKGYSWGKQALSIAVGEADVPYGFSTIGHNHDARLLPLWREAIKARCGEVGG